MVAITPCADSQFFKTQPGLELFGLVYRAFLETVADMNFLIKKGRQNLSLSGVGRNGGGAPL